MITETNAVSFRQNLGEMLSQVQYRHDSVVINKDGKPVAAQFWITTADEACIYKLAYDEQYAEMSVGAVLSREMFRQALDIDRVARIDYGVGSEAYKREWMSASQEIFGVRAYSRRSIGGLWQILYSNARAAAKRIVAKLFR